MGEVGPLRVSTGSPRPGVALVVLDGEVDLATAPEVIDRVRALARAGARHLVFDLRRVRFFGSSGVGMLVNALSQTRHDTGPEAVHLIGATTHPIVAPVLSITGIGKMFRHHPTVDALLAHLDHD